MDAWSCSHPPTKTLPFHGDMTKGRLCHVPAFISSTWRPAKPRTGTTIYGDTCIYLFGLHIQSELRVTLVQSGSWNFICILESWYLIPRGDMNFCRMSTEHQLMNLFFHWTLDGLGFWFWGRCHDRCIPQQNSRSCFSSSVCVCLCQEKQRE